MKGTCPRCQAAVEVVEQAGRSVIGPHPDPKNRDLPEYDPRRLCTASSDHLDLSDAVPD